MRCKMFIRDQCLWKEGGESKTGQSMMLNCDVGLTKASLDHLARSSSVGITPQCLVLHWADQLFIPPPSLLHVPEKLRKTLRELWRGECVSTSKGPCYSLNVCPPQYSYAEALTPNVMVLGGGTFGEWWSLDEVMRVRMSWWDYRRQDLSLSADAVFCKGLSTSILVFLAFRIVRNKCEFCKPPSLW